MATKTSITKPRDNKITRLIVPALYENKGLSINEVIDPRTGKPVEALYFYDALKQGIIVQLADDVRTGKRGRPAKRWNLTKSTRDRITKQRKRAEARELVAA